MSIRNNARSNITGMLFRSEGHFVQFLEGKHASVNELFEVIAKDRRHEDVRLLYHRPATERLFAEWHMAMLDLDLHTRSERLDLQEMVRLTDDPTAYEDGQPADLAILARFQHLFADVPLEYKLARD